MIPRTLAARWELQREQRCREARGNREVNIYPCHLCYAKMFLSIFHTCSGPSKHMSWKGGGEGLLDLFGVMFIFIFFSFAHLPLLFPSPFKKTPKGSFDVIGPDTTVFAIIEGDYWGDEYATLNALKTARKNNNPNKAHTVTSDSYFPTVPLWTKNNYICIAKGGRGEEKSCQAPLAWQRVCEKCNRSMPAFLIILWSVWDKKGFSIQLPSSWRLILLAFILFILTFKWYWRLAWRKIWCWHHSHQTTCYLRVVAVNVCVCAQVGCGAGGEMCSVFQSHTEQISRKR